MRRYGRRRTFRRKLRRTGRRSGGIRSTIRRTVRAMAETKFRIDGFEDTVVAAVPVSFGWFNGIVVGPASDQRIGNQITSKRLTARFHYNWAAVIGGVDIVVTRLCIVFPRKGIDNADILSWMSTNYNCYVKIDPRLFITLYDKVWTMQSPIAGQGTGASPYFCVKRISIKKSRFVMNYDLSNQVARQPYVFMVADYGEGNPSQLLLHGWMCTSFKDL